MDWAAVVLSLLVLVGGYIARKWLIGKETEHKDGETRGLREEIIDFAKVAVRGVEGWARNKLRKEGLVVTSSQKFDNVMNALTDRFPNVKEDEARVIIEYALVNGAALYNDIFEEVEASEPVKETEDGQEPNEESEATPEEEAGSAPGSGEGAEEAPAG